MELTEYIPDDSFLSAPTTVRAVFKAGASCEKLTPLMFDSEDKNALVAWDGTNAAVAISARQVTESTEEQVLPIYSAGGFRISFINWPESVSTDKQKRAVFLGSAVYVDDEY